MIHGSDGRRGKGSRGGSQATSGPFWLRYRQEQEARIAAKAAAREGVRICIEPGCNEPVVARVGAVKTPLRCVVHADLAEQCRRLQYRRQRREATP